MSDFSDLYEQLYNFFGEEWLDSQDRALIASGDRLSVAPRIRLWAGGATGLDAQSATVDVLRQLAAPTADRGFGYAHEVELYYERQAPSDPTTTLQKLQLLLPEVGSGTTGAVGQAAVRLVEYNSLEVITTPAPFGFTGAAGLRDAVSTFADQLASKLNTDYFVRLDTIPGGTGPYQIQFKDGRQPICLTCQRSLGEESFGDRLTYTKSPMAEPNWAMYSSGPWASQASMVKLLTTGLHAWDTCPLLIDAAGDDLQTARPVVERMFDAVTAVLASQRDSSGSVRPGAKSVVIMSCDRFATSERSTLLAELQRLLAGGLSDSEVRTQARLQEDDAELRSAYRLPQHLRAQYEASLGGHQARAEWLDQASVSSRVEILWNPTPSLLTEKLAFVKAANDRVLLVQFGSIPMPLFGWSMQQSGWPSVFAGQSPSTYAVNFGGMFFNLPDPGGSGTQYPATLVGYQSAAQDPDPAEPGKDVRGRAVFLPGAAARRVQQAADALSRPLAEWSPTPALNPAETAGGLVRDYQTEGAQGPLHAYFHQVAQLWQQPQNDQLRMAAAFLTTVIDGEEKKKALAQQPGASAAVSVMDKLLIDIKNNYDSTEKTLNVVPGTFPAGSGEIYDFYHGFLGSLELRDASYTPIPATGTPTTIIAEGDTDIVGVPLHAKITFTAPQDVIVASGRYTQPNLAWYVEQIPWIGLLSPFVDLYITDSGAPPSGAVGGTLAGAGMAELAFRLPVAEGKWELNGSFAPDPDAADGTEYPSIGSFYALAGGVDLVRALPDPFSGLFGFGLENVQLIYDTNAGAIEYTGFRMSTAAPFRLVGDVMVKNVSADVVIQHPADLAERTTHWTVRGTFSLSSAADAGVVALSAAGPDLELTGALQSGTLALAEIVRAFAPGVVVNLPGKQVAEISEFQCQFTPGTGDYQVACALSLDWPVYVPGSTNPWFTIQDLRFTATRLASSTDGQLTGNVAIGSGDAAVQLALTANYAQEKGWNFLAVQSPDTAFDLKKLINQFLPSNWWNIPAKYDYQIADLKLSYAADAGDWTFSGRAVGWTVPFMLSATISAELALGYTDAEWTGRLDALLAWHGVEITAFFDYAPGIQKYGIAWGGLSGLLEGPDGGPWTATLKFTADTTIGSMIETMVSWATGARFNLEAPWSVLNSVGLGGLSLTYTFGTGSGAGANTVAFNVLIGPIELGFARIDGFSAVYDSAAEQKVSVKLTGSFPWLADADGAGDTDQLGPWDAAEPGTAPGPPGGGNDYFDLRLLALGQHVTDDNLPTADTVQQAIVLMGELDAPEPGKIPTVAFDPGAGWIIGADMGILKLTGDDASRVGDGGESGYMVTAQVVFNDPYLYGLRLALAGAPAKIFAGLDFQIMYRQVGDTVGVYQAELTLPDAMRRLSIGAYTITLPVVAVSVYTNGDFKVDLGFPWDSDFSRSFTVEGIIAPGIPFTGAAGLYFAKLSSATTDLVPAATNGTFNPVLAFGLGAQFGFGKSVEYGPLKAGFSATISGVIEGVLATFNPYTPAIGGGDAVQVQDGYYFWLRGTFGIAGRLYGSIDFSVVKAEVNVALGVSVQITYESYVSMSATVVLSVDVSVSIRIDLGIFSFRISFTFSMRIEETFTIANGGTPPWTVAAPAEQHALTGPADRRHRHAATPSDEVLRAVAASDPWNRLQPGLAKADLAGWFAPALTFAHNEYDIASPPNPAQQAPCYALLTMIQTVPDTEGTVEEVVRATAAADSDTSFEKLAKMVLRWVVAAGQTQDLPPELIDDRIVAEADLAFVLNTLLAGGDGDPAPILPSDIDTFMNRQFTMTMVAPSDTASGNVSTTVFPIPPALRVTASGGSSTYPGYNYVLSGYNTVPSATVREMRAYFDQTAVLSQDTNTPAPVRGSADVSMSMAQWVQSDYFLLLARQMTQLALDALRDFKFENDGAMPNTMVATINSNGGLTGDERYTVAALFTANSNHPLNALSPICIGPTVRTRAGDSFAEVAAAALGSAVSPTFLATANAGNTALFGKDALIVFEGAPYRPKSDDSLITVAAHFHTRVMDLLAGSPGLLTDTTLLKADAKLVAPLAVWPTQAGDTFTDIAKLPVFMSGGAHPFTPQQLATSNAGCPVLRTGAVVSIGGKPVYTVQPGDTLVDVATALSLDFDALLAQTNVLSNPELPADVALLILPEFFWKTGADTNTTLANAASRFAIDIATLAMAEDNGKIKELFATVDPVTKASLPWLDVPHLPKYKVSEILAEIQRTLGIRQLSRMTARYALHGTRLPTKGVTPNSPGMWVTGPKNDQLPELAGLYALTGQQVPVPGAIQSNFSLTLTRTTDPAWLRFDPKSVYTQLIVTVTPSSEDASRIKALTAAATSPVTIGLTSLGADPMYRSAPVSYPLTSSAVWQSPATVPLPYVYGTRDAVQALRIWSLPDALTNLPDPSIPGRVLPRFALRLATYDEATGATGASDVHNYGWATTVNFTVRRVPPVAGSPTSEDTCEIVGAGGADVVLLERIVAQLGANDNAFHTVAVAFPPDAATPAASGVQSYAPATTTLGIAQANLSTETHPPAFAAADDAAAGAPVTGLLNTKSEFIRLLWEACITRAGGFYLYYRDVAARRGLPDRIFNDRGEAALSLIVIYADSQSLADNRIADFMNAAVTGDSFDGTNAVVVAQAAPIKSAVTATDTITLADIAARTYSDLGDLAIDNQTVALRPGALIDVVSGVYQAPLNGITLQALAEEYKIPGGAQALQTANPQWGGALPNTISFPTAIFFPTLRLNATVSPYSSTLAEIARKYGVDLTSLAAHNPEKLGIFKPGLPITTAGGPVARTATVPPGAVAASATRNQPPAIPDKASIPGYADTFFRNTFSLLGYRIAPNKFFDRSPIGLPAGPTPPPANLSSAADQATASSRLMDKVRLPAASTVWDYRQSLPYPDYAIPKSATAANLPPADGNPYRGLGSILQIGYYWQDYYGNTLVTDLDVPSANNDPLAPRNQPPMLTGYTDPIIPLSAWPSIAPAWRVAGTPGQARLELPLSFDPTRYQGLVKAQAPNSSLIEAFFTDQLAPAATQDLSAYRLTVAGDDETEIPLSAAQLIDNDRTVRLTPASPLTDRLYVLTVTDLPGVSVGGASVPSYSGSATFAFPNAAAAATSTVVERANRDLVTYTALYYQLTDTNGMAATVSTSLLTGPGGVGDGALPLDPDRWSKLLNWLFYDNDSILAFLQTRASGSTAPLTPPARHTVSFPLPAPNTALNPAQIYPLSVSFTLARGSGSVLGALQATAGMRAASTAVAPLVHALDSQQQQDSDDTLGLAAFAEDFENALSVPDSYWLKVAGGVDRRVAAARDTATLWAVRIGADTQSAAHPPISYTIADAGTPDLFAPRPISNQLQSRRGVLIYDFIPGQGIAPPQQATRKLDFVDVDLDVWGRTLLAAVDEVLTPQFTAALQIVGNASIPKADLLQRILEQKKLLARACSAWMIPLLETQSGKNAPNPGPVREAFYQTLLAKLSAAYATRAGIQFHANVNATIPEPGATEPPQLFGSVLIDESTGEHRNEIGLTSPKLPLITDDGVPLPFLLTAPETVDEDGVVVGSLGLDLTWSGASIEHQIAPPQGISSGYLASSWLSFISPKHTEPLTRDLGSFDVPLVLRAFPATPGMTGHNGFPDDELAPTLAALTKWTYDFSWSLPFHYPQDRIHGEVTFNVVAPGAETAAAMDVFEAMAQFVNVYPEVRRELETLLSRIDPANPDQKAVQESGVAANALVQLLTNVTTAAAAAGGLIVDTPPKAAESSAPDLTFAFEIAETATAQKGQQALLVTLTTALPPGIGIPSVLVDAPGYHPIPPDGPQPPPPPGMSAFRFVYYNFETNRYLSPAEGQQIPGRTVTVPGMDAFQRQDAWAAVRIARNEQLVPTLPRTVKPFVYTTPSARCADPVLPSIDSRTPIDIAQLHPSNPVLPLESQLEGLLVALFANLPASPQTELVVQLEAVYEYRLTPALGSISLPIFFQPPGKMMAAGGNTVSADMKERSDAWSKAIKEWFRTGLPSGADGVLHFDLVVLSNLTKSQMPLVRLRNAMLAIKDINPPLDVR